MRAKSHFCAQCAARPEEVSDPRPSLFGVANAEITWFLSLGVGDHGLHDSCDPSRHILSRQRTGIELDPIRDRFVISAFRIGAQNIADIL
jgi:hypothetical protein